MIFNFTLLSAGSTSIIALKFIDEQQNEFIIKTTLKINPTRWNADKQRPENIYLKIYKKLNAKLDAIKIAVSNYLKEVVSKQRKFSLNVVTRLIKKCCVLSESSFAKGSLLEATENFIQSRLHLISGNTHRRYKVFFSMLKRFEGFQQKHLMLNEVNSNFVKDFIKFGELETYSSSTIYRTIYFVRTVLNFL